MSHHYYNTRIKWLQCTTFSNGVSKTVRHGYRFVGIDKKGKFSGFPLGFLLKSWTTKRTKSQNIQLFGWLDFCYLIKRLAYVRNLCSLFEAQIMPRAHARNYEKNWGREPNKGKDRFLFSVLIVATKYCNTRVPACSGFNSMRKTVRSRHRERDWYWESAFSLLTHWKGNRTCDQIKLYPLKVKTPLCDFNLYNVCKLKIQIARNNNRLESYQTSREVINWSQKISMILTFIYDCNVLQQLCRFCLLKLRLP